MTVRGADNDRDEELGALTRLQQLPDFLVYVALLRRHVEDLRRGEHHVLVDEKTVARHNYRVGQVDGLLLASQLPDLIAQARSKKEETDG